MCEWLPIAVWFLVDVTFVRDVLRVCAECDELKVPVRRAEKRLLNELNKQVRYPPPKKEIIRTPADKVERAVTILLVLLKTL